MKRLLILPLFLAGCGTGDPQDGNATGAEAAQRQAVRTAELTGLYEGAARGARRDQLCIIDRATGNSRFGLVTWSEGDRNCSGIGQAVRDGGTLRLTMAGDEQCVIEATIANGTVTMPGEFPQGCAYYCGPGASMAEARFEKTGDTAEDAMRATDLVGDPLCAEWPG
ncbi:MAG: hypothetical protein ACK4K7_07885 [Allosphingosinicella sp.]|uniref:hypothetical protein n=1 Tax=Allosphingosinicella sp. TaxID=2823234 RepID=UPI0039419853